MERPQIPQKEAIMFSAKSREKSIGKMRSIRLLAVFLIPVAALILGAAATQVWAQEISEAEIFFEFNSTDLDLGFDIFFDADPWRAATLTDPNGTEYFLVNTGGGLFEQGNTEIFTESAEPPFCEEVAEELCDEDFIQGKIDEFQAGFEDGFWELIVEFADGTISEPVVIELDHALPAAPDIRRPKEEQNLKKVKDIRWRDTSTGTDPEIISYEVVAEMVVLGEDEEELTYVNTATLPGTAKKFTISKEFMSLAKRAKKRGKLVEFKAEVIARGANLNKTITEVPVFEFEDDEDEEEEEE
jgi:hypothetical protein